MPDNLIYAFTDPQGSYPSYVNATRLADGTVKLTVRSAPTKSMGVYLCGYSQDKGAPGRCTPGDDRCNNYCNMAPSKGPMAHAPLACEHTIQGATASMILSEADWQSLVMAIRAEADGRSA